MCLLTAITHPTSYKNALIIPNKAIYPLQETD